VRRTGSFFTESSHRDDPEASRRKGIDLCRRALQFGGDDPNVLSSVAYTLGYFGDQADARLVRAGMAAWRDRAVARCTVERIHLVQVPTDQLVAYPALESIESFPLAGGPIVERL
jgi:hypothetical protein